MHNRWDTEVYRNAIRHAAVACFGSLPQASKNAVAKDLSLGQIMRTSSREQEAQQGLSTSFVMTVQRTDMILPPEVRDDIRDLQNDVEGLPELTGDVQVLKNDISTLGS